MNSSALRLVGIASAILGILVVLYFTFQSFNSRNAGQEAIFDEDITYTEARSLARKDGKDVFVLALATWCPHCAALDRSALSDEGVQSAITEGTIPVRVNISGRAVDPERWPEIERLNIKSVPTLILMSPEGQELDRITGVVKADDLTIWIKSHGKIVPETLGESGDLDDS